MDTQMVIISVVVTNFVQEYMYTVNELRQLVVNGRNFWIYEIWDTDLERKTNRLMYEISRHYDLHCYKNY